MQNPFMLDLDTTDAVSDVGALHRYFADAAELGLPPGVLPGEIVLTGRNVGNGMPLRLVRSSSQAFVYQQDCGIVQLTIWND